jgi:hypothetical protein
MRKAGGYGLNSEGLGCGSLTDFCDYNIYSSGFVKAGKGWDILTTVGLCTMDLLVRLNSAD